ncbi:MAG: pantoate--beta-alanine ligase [Candidatus Omnitrophota bacterium]|jgi:pantoate--beta-alanine ligase
MKIITHIKTIQDLTQKLRREGKQIGFVPTMGYLHDGHRSLLKVCHRQNDISVLSIFVNPVQFGPQEDFQSYPRDKKNDVLLAKEENVDIIFYPSVRTMYPRRYLTYINVEEMTGTLCGASRPGHFRGVTTVVGKLLNIVRPHKIYFGQKDAQQCAVIRQMVKDLNIPVQLRVLPTVREKDGLALSSRNAYLTAEERREAPVLYQALKMARTKIHRGERDSRRLIRMTEQFLTNGCHRGEIEYVMCVEAETLQPVKIIQGDVLIALAVRLGKARLIDNILLRVRN